MKARVSKAETKELPLKEFLAKFPNYKSFCVSNNIDIEDTNYIVRYNGNYVEVGYAEDEWGITKNGFDKSAYEKLVNNPNAKKGTAYQVQVIETPLKKFLTKETGYFGSDVPKKLRETFCKNGVDYKTDFINHGINVDDDDLRVRFCSELHIIEIGYENDEWVLGDEEKGFRADLLPPVSELDTNASYILLKAKSIS